MLPHVQINALSCVPHECWLLKDREGKITGRKWHGPQWHSPFPRWPLWLRSLNHGQSFMTTSPLWQEKRWNHHSCDDYDHHDHYDHHHHLKLVGGWNKVCQGEFCCLLFKNKSTEWVPTCNIKEKYQDWRKRENPNNFFSLITALMASPSEHLLDSMWLGVSSHHHHNNW